MAEHLPIFKGALYNTTKSENTDFFASDLTPTYTPTTFLIYYAGTNSGGQTGYWPYLKRTNGGNTVIENIASGANAPSWAVGVPTTFQVLVGPGDSINLKMPTGSGSAGILTLIVIEIETATGTPYLHP